MRSNLNVPQGTKLQTSSKLVIYRTDDGQFHLAWKLILYSQKPVVDWLYIVDAGSGEPLYKLNLITDVTGNGDVYPTYPGLSSVTNESLYGLLGNGHLDGTYVDVYNDAAIRAYSSSNSFQYTHSNTHFDEVSLYYHVDNYRRNFIENLDAGNLLFGKLDATVHDNTTCPNNACFSYSDQGLHFSDTYDFANEDKVIYHEYTHAVIDDIDSGIISSNNEEGAISEGTPDYFAGSFTVRSKILNYALPFAERDMANPDISSYSQYTNDQQYPNVESHRGGEFFSSILWSLHNSLGASTTDFLAYDALYRVTGNPDFLSFRDAMISADYQAYNGSDVNAIQDAFAAKGVGLYSPPHVTIAGPTSIDVGEVGHWTSSISGGTGGYSYAWYKYYGDPNYTGPNPVLISTTSTSATTGDENGTFSLTLYVTYPGSEEGIGNWGVIVTGGGCLGGGCN